MIFEQKPGVDPKIEAVKFINEEDALVVVTKNETHYSLLRFFNLGNKTVCSCDLQNVHNIGTILKKILGMWHKCTIV